MSTTGGTSPHVIEAVSSSPILHSILQCTRYSSQKESKIPGNTRQLTKTYESFQIRFPITGWESQLQNSHLLLANGTKNVYARKIVNESLETGKAHGNSPFQQNLINYENELQPCDSPSYYDCATLQFGAQNQNIGFIVSARNSYEQTFFDVDSNSTENFNVFSQVYKSLQPEDPLILPNEKKFDEMRVEVMEEQEDAEGNSKDFQYPFQLGFKVQSNLDTDCKLSPFAESSSSAGVENNSNSETIMEVGNSSPKSNNEPKQQAILRSTNPPRMNKELKNGKWVYTCRICNQRLSSSSAACRHVHIHESPSNKRSFNCSYCPKQFLRKDSARFHEQTHTKIKSFACEFCNRPFRWPAALVKHRKSVHKEESS